MVVLSLAVALGACATPNSGKPKGKKVEVSKPKSAAGSASVAESLAVVQFPGDVTSEVIQRKDALARWKAPTSLTLKPGEARVAGHQVLFSVLLSNPAAEPFVLVVNPYGGRFPYGGNSPLTFSFTRAAGKVVRYSGKLYPPAPPRPMSITLPAQKTVRFDAFVDLRRYSYDGTPKVSMRWGFHYHQGEAPKGTVEVVLPPRASLPAAP